MNKKVNIQGPHQGQPVFYKGKQLETADAAMIMIHGRGATAESILTLADEFGNGSVSYIAPQANMNTWYPYSFLSPIEMNEPGITSGLEVIDSIVSDLISKGFSTDRIFLLGFSQGACLSLEYVARNPAKFGGVFGLSGGLIGPPHTPRNYEGSFDNAEIFLGCSDVDPHIPIERVDETEKVFLEMNANVTKRIYKGMGHNINQDEINFIKSLLRGAI
ncbi:MAG: phospholipase [Ignavibacteria bacterium]|nr:phospholipase [Ignavibacteria bacterium]